jgi:methionine-rich copper-binding protein CopC
MTTTRTRFAALATATLALGLTLGVASPAAAHNYVVSSTPEDGATITEVPRFFIISASDVMLDLAGDGAGFGLQVTDDEGRYYGDGCITVQGAELSTAGDLGSAGEYTLTYQFISADGHTVSDSLAFRYEPSAGAVEKVGASSPPQCGSTSATAPGDAPANDEASTVVGVIVGIVIGLVALAVLVALVIRRRSGSDADASADEVVPPSSA